MQNRHKFVLLAFAFALFQSGCARQAVSPWAHKLNALPAELRLFVFEHFDSDKELRKKRPNSASPRAEAITDNPVKFDASCTVYPGYSRILFVRARQMGNRWLIQYEFGGIAHGAALLLVYRGADGSYRASDPIYLRALNPTDEEIEQSISMSKSA